MHIAFIQHHGIQYYYYYSRENILSGVENKEQQEKYDVHWKI